MEKENDVRKPAQTLEAIAKWPRVGTMARAFWFWDQSYAQLDVIGWDNDELL